MSKSISEKKKQQLGMSQGAARNKLVKMLLFEFAKKEGKDICYQCGEKIKNIDNFSIEHKTPWLNSSDPVSLYFDLDNIAFSHTSCNYKAARRTRPYKHPSRRAYEIYGCRCDECKEIQKNVRKRQREKQTL